jgi:hypothetical protein
MAPKKKRTLKFEATPEEIRAMYDKIKREFSLADLKAFEVDEKDTVPFATVLRDLKKMVREAKAKRKSG